ncbi:butyrophilin-like protein 3 [Colossoma macropomum]|uniref:butyrophilin-like protein 3 n=1 Tax=Colossoma macropomum TaxID=42526 RepID=UPI0018650049|nr:butyrophilin-like protein 3 [Colossoma macropomum]
MDLLFFVLLLAAGLQGLHVEGPSGPLVVPLGGAVLLPCSAQDPLPLEGLRVEWSRTDSESVVNVFQQKEIRAELQSQSFRGRADFFPEEISRGNFSILLSDVTPEDAGVYRCGVSSSQDYRETTVEIKLSERLVVRGALHPIFTSVGEEVILSCSVDSQIPVHQLEEVTWKKHPDIPVLLFQENQTFSEFSHESYRERAEFFTTEIPRGNFSLRLKDVRMEDKGEFICEVHTADPSGQTTVIIQRIGFSSVQICILVMCFTSLTLAVGLGVPVFYLSTQTSYNQTYHDHAYCTGLLSKHLHVHWFCAVVSRGAPQ